MFHVPKHIKARKKAGKAVPAPNSRALFVAGQGLWREKTVLAGLQAFHDVMGDAFKLELPGFKTVMLVGPQANRMILASEREKFLWRPEGEPVANLLDSGVLVTDGDAHDNIRRLMNPALHRQMLSTYVDKMVTYTDQVSANWQVGQPIRVLDEMRKIALLILTDTLFRKDFTPELQRLWQANLRTIKYISPGLWVFWRGVPRPGYADAIQQMDTYLFRIITERRANLGPVDDLLGGLIAAGLDDKAIRDQLLTMLIAGHDTSTALLSWTLCLLNQHPQVYERLQDEIDQTLGGAAPNIQNTKDLEYLGWVLDEVLRLYPPIHLGSRITTEDVCFGDYRLPSGTRVMYSIYLSHRHGDYWPRRHAFWPERWRDDPRKQLPPYTYLPFGGGPRNCIGMAFAQVEAKIVLVRLLQAFRFGGPTHPQPPQMHATLEPPPNFQLIPQMH